MFIENQPLFRITKEELPARAAELARQGFRLVQICCTQTDGFELTYSFDKDYAFQNLRVTVLNGELPVPSITDSYFCAFTYENEIHDLFGIPFRGLAPDFKGNFYRKSVKAPFLKTKPAAKE